MHVQVAMRHLIDSTLGTIVSSESFGDGLNTVSESAVSDIELGEFFGPRWVPGGELIDCLLAHYVRAGANSPSFSQNLSSLFRSSTLEIVLCMAF